MKRIAISFVLLSSLLAFAGDPVFPEQFTSDQSKLLLHGNSDRKQQLVFVPDAPGMQNGYWRIVWENGDKLAELLIPGGIALPDFQRTLQIEMDIECSSGAVLLASDLRLRDSQGEVCSLNSDRGNKHSGAIHAVWVIDKDQYFKMAWGKNVNHKLDFPASIENFAFLLQKNEGDAALKNLRITADPAPTQK